MSRFAKIFECCTKASNITKIQPFCHTDCDVEAYNFCKNEDCHCTSPQNDQCQVKFKNLEISRLVKFV